MHATNEVQDSLLTAADEEGKMCEHFVYSAFSVDQSGSVCNPMPTFKKMWTHVLKIKPQMQIRRTYLRSQQSRSSIWQTQG